MPRPELRPVEAQPRRATLDLLTYVVGNALFWGLWGALTVSTGEWYWWPVVPLTGWAVVLALHLRYVHRTAS